jgi:hypothetical protein
MYSIKIKCPHCLHLVHLNIQRITEYTCREPMALNEANGRPTFSVRSVSNNTVLSAYSTATCPECYGPVLLAFQCHHGELQKIQKSTTDAAWTLNGVTPQNITVYPELKNPDDSPYYPEKIRRTFIELQEDIQMKRTAPRIVVGCRSVLEVALRNLGYENGNLLSRIEKARADGILTESMKNWAHRIRMDGNEAVHELESSDAEAAEFVSFLRLFLEVTFVLPERVSKAQSPDQVKV